MVNTQPRQSTAFARKRYETDYYLGKVGYCLKNVRECLGIDPYYESAKEAWEAAKHKTVTADPDEWPFGAPVFSERPGGSLYGHVFLAGGRFQNGQRILWQTDATGRPGMVTPVTPAFITGVWGHRILGFSRDLNGVPIPYLLDGKGK